MLCLSPPRSRLDADAREKCLRHALPALPAITEQAEESNASESERSRFGDGSGSVRLQTVVYHIITRVGQLFNAHGGRPAVPLETPSPGRT